MNMVGVGMGMGDPIQSIAYIVPFPPSKTSMESKKPFHSAKWYVTLEFCKQWCTSLRS